MLRKVWSFVAILAVLGMLFIALPHLPSMSFTTWDGVFSVAWLGLAGCVIAGQSLELRRKRKRPAAKLPLRQPKPITYRRTRADS